MGNRVLAVAGDAAPNRTLRVYTHCLARVPEKDLANGGVALAIINLQNLSAIVRIVANNTGTSIQWNMTREVYRMGTVEGKFSGHRTSINDVEMLVEPGGILPEIMPITENASLPLALAPLSVNFVALPYAKAKACT
eukprot:SAG31_NODE_5328_length_2605_cov_2.959346_3_plen_137_part_00